MAKRIRLKPGDIYRFDLDENHYGLGQVIETGDVFYTTTLRNPVGHEFDLEEVDTSDILLCGRTTDARLHHGYWKVVGNLPVPESGIPRPCSKVESAGARWVQDFHCKLIRLATDFEWEHLDYHSSQSPIAYEEAFRAYYGLAEAQPHRDKIGIAHVRAQAAICSA
jgi:hypothetical protein